MYTYIRIHICVSTACLEFRMCSLLYIYIYIVYVYVCVCVYLYICVCVCIWGAELMRKKLIFCSASSYIFSP